ncbi:hypothetical protein B566_EDAN003507 [Ephemera danica]|nr:hypothetical protein B566_EDAN003507 [Ephemera danica]
MQAVRLGQQMEPMEGVKQELSVIRAGELERGETIGRDDGERSHSKLQADSKSKIQSKNSKFQEIRSERKGAD